MNISSVVNPYFGKVTKSEHNNKISKNNNVAFKGIYIDSLVDLGNAKGGMYPAKFLPKDALLLNEIASKYPNQDCFIRKGYAGRPRLEYREKPPEVTVFNSDLAKCYNVSIESTDKDYPCEPLLIYQNSDLNFLIGVPSFISTNPSLPYTVKVGFELHKKLLAEKMKIMDIVGKNDNVNIGGQSIIQKAHSRIEELETAVTRYLVESAYSVLIDKASASQIYSSNFPKIQAVLDAKRKFDLTTSLARQIQIEADNAEKNNDEFDVCDLASKYYPDYKENIARIDLLTTYMKKHGITLDDSEDLTI